MANAEVFGFRSGRSYKNLDPQAVGQELTRLRELHGTLTPEIVLEAASDPASPLHAGFEWDKDEAARQHRLQQARRLIVSIRVLNTPVRTPTAAFVSVRTPDKGREYVPTVEALQNQDLRARVLDEARQAVESLERRYRHFEEVAEVLDRLRQAVG